jgi:hypothetical protein
MNRFGAAVLLSVEQVVLEMDPVNRLSEETVRQCILALIGHLLAERPSGEKGGARLTNAGRRLAGKIAD